MSKRGAIFLRKSALSGETNNPMPTTPIPVTSKGNNLNVNSPDKFISLANSRITSHSPIKSSDANDKSKDDDSESSDSYGKLEWVLKIFNSLNLILPIDGSSEGEIAINWVSSDIELQRSQFLRKLQKWTSKR